MSFLSKSLNQISAFSIDSCEIKLISHLLIFIDIASFFNLEPPQASHSNFVKYLPNSSLCHRSDLLSLFSKKPNTPLKILL